MKKKNQKELIDMKGRHRKNDITVKLIASIMGQREKI